MQSHPLSGWVPYKLLRDDQHSVCRWLHVDNTPFSEPFFADTISRCRSNNSRQLHSVSNIELLPDWSASLPYVKPSAFIFHISRCGSTLLAQLLGINPQNIVLSEVPFFDEALRTPYQQRKPNLPSSAIFQAAMQFYGQQRSGNEKNLFVKTDSWHVCFYKTIRQLYPGVPFILLYRHPQQVIRSQQKKRGMHAVPGVVEAAVFEFDGPPVTDLDVHMARVIERYLTLFLEIIQHDKNALLVNYNEGMLKVTEKVAAFAGVDINDEEHEKMEARCKFNAKYPDQLFSETDAEKAVPDYLQNCMSLYHQLLQLHR